MERLAARMAEQNASFAKIVNEAALELRYGKKSRWEIADAMDRQMKEARELHAKGDHK